MNRRKTVLLCTAVAGVVRDYFVKAVEPLLARVAELEQRQAIPGPKGDPGERGETGPAGLNPDASMLRVAIMDQLAQLCLGDVVRDEVAKAVLALGITSGRDGVDGRDGRDVDLTVLHAEVTQAVAALPIPKDGKDGVDGKAVDPVEVARLIRDEVTQAVAALPIPKDGKDGVDGKAVDPVEVARLIRDEVTQAVAALPIPKDGKDGVDGKAMDPVEVAALVRAEAERAVAALPIPKDGIGLSGAVIDREGVLVLTLSDGSTKAIGVVVGATGPSIDLEDVRRLVDGELSTWPRPKDGIDGKDGRDGTLEQLSFELIDERTGRFVRADGSEVGRVTLAIPIYHGVFVEGTAYAQGDLVTFGGSMWYAREATRAKPGAGATPWILATKKGSDGKAGEKGSPGERGPIGPKGDPGRNYS